MKFICTLSLSISVVLSLHGTLSKIPFKLFTNAQNCQYWHYCQFCVPIYLKFLLYLHMSIRDSWVKVAFFISSLFLLAQVKRSWQYCHSCIVESVFKTLLSLCVNNDNVAFLDSRLKKIKRQIDFSFALMKCDLWYYYMFKHKWIFLLLTGHAFSWKCRLRDPISHFSRDRKDETKKL